MAGQALSLSRSLGVLFETGVVGDVPDGQLLERFTAGNDVDEHAFDALVERHGPMVLRVCQRLLDDANDADDAFQATFLVLLRQARSIRHRDSVAAWLHGVALRVATRARVECARRRRIERNAGRRADDRNHDPDRLDLEALFDVEVARLPAKYRQPIVLCYFEELTHECAADRLGWPVGTVRGRLARARDLLRCRLTRRGITAFGALGASSGVGRAAVGTALREATVRVAAQAATGRELATVTSAQVAGWVRSASRGLVWSNLKTTVGLLVLLVMVGTGLELATLGAAGSYFQAPQADRSAPAPAPEREDIRREMLQLKGTWSSLQKVESTVNGVPQKPTQFKMLWSIDRDLITDTDESGFAARSYSYTLDPKERPNTLDLTVRNTGLILHGIYKLEGDSLTVCLSAGERPSDFEEKTDPFRILCRFQRESRTPAHLVQEFPNATDCYWAVEPSGGVPASTYTNGIDLIVKKDPQGAFVVMVAYVTRFQGDTPDLEYRPVAFGEQRVRCLPAVVQGGWSGSGSIRGATVVMREYRLDPAVLRFDQVKSLGIEVIPPEVRRAARERASVRALEVARDAGVEILPRPVVGEPFEFSLTDTKGRVIRSAELKGKVVLIDCWAGWCAPCMAKMPRLKALYERRHADGFEVVGVNFDHDRTRADELVKALGLPWAEVHVPDDERARELWAEGPGITTLPRLFLIDRAGILRWEGGPGELEQRISSLFE
jgi:RNA polymerase sigma factor (sigma-70 family)